MTNPPPPGWEQPHTGPRHPFGEQQSSYGFEPAAHSHSLGQPPAPGQNKGLKLLLIGIAVLLVIAISVGVTLIFTRTDGGTDPTAATNATATGNTPSSQDASPISIITEDPTCEPWRPINDTLVDAQHKGWAERDFTLPASNWTQQERSMHEEVADAMRRAADQTTDLIQITPNRIMRELYEQSIAYWRAYADSIPNYELKDNSLAVTASDTSGAIVTICAAIDYRSAAKRGPLVPGVDPKLSPAPPKDPANVEPFLSSTGNEVCAEWTAISDRFDDETREWRESDGNQPASEWTPERRAMTEKVASIMLQYADSIQSLGERSGNATLYDFATLAAQYFRAYTKAIPTYTSADSYLSATASYANFIVYNACAAVKG
ncbi:hypothetical protein O6072_08305 [Mycolicibacterium neoaurum]|uniref:hypothetical protein n=1 Tax=Mycolicibacterium neoaurum TaxID=1795 RepID=UPI00248CF180|nr:hypothetical protein [Mycolicibacterium neoaurum]WBP96156.1 hypothetical protein O7W24_08310 [Mycolicibacterium neoaurum]WBS09841.1 hypothetical protein O6072_08305 [Mycolicibacterium neoaurum]